MCDQYETQDCNRQELTKISANCNSMAQILELPIMVNQVRNEMLESTKTIKDLEKQIVDEEITELSCDDA